MSIESRIESLEQKFNIKRRCTLLIVLYDGMEGPTEEQTDQYRNAQKESGRCENCGGLCSLNWVEALRDKPRWLT